MVVVKMLITCMDLSGVPSDYHTECTTLQSDVTYVDKIDIVATSQPQPQHQNRSKEKRCTSGPERINFFLIEYLLLMFVRYLTELINIFTIFTDFTGTESCIVKLLTSCLD